MHCPNCGAKVDSARFCPNCGKPLTTNQTAGKIRDYTSYEAIVADARAKELLQREAAGARRAASEQEIFESIERIVPVPVPVSLIVEVYSALGVKTGKIREQVVNGRYAYAILGALSYLVRQSMPVTRVSETVDGCIVHAVLPPSWWHWQGEVVIAFINLGSQAKVHAAVKIPGQMYDWGKSKAYLQGLFETVNERVMTFTRQDL